MTHQLFLLFLEYYAFVGPKLAFLVPKAGDTSMGQIMLKASLFFLTGLIGSYVLVYRRRKIKQYREAYYPDRRLNIHGEFVL